MKGKKQKVTIKKIQNKLFRTQLILVLTLALFLGGSAVLTNIHFETEKRDQNLQNVAEAIARSPILTEKEISLIDEEYSLILIDYLDSLKETMDNIDVISLVDSDNVRVYHSNHELIGTVYDGTLPDFRENSDGYYATTDSGPSGMQRRAYAAVYDEDGNYIGFVMAIMLMQNIHRETSQIVLVYILITLAAIFVELLISAEMSKSIKTSLKGYEPDAFTAMYQIRDNILESLDEGVIAVNKDGKVEFVNQAAVSMLEETMQGIGKDIVGKQLDHVEKLGSEDLLIDQIPIKENGENVGTVGILHNRAEYTKLMEDLTGTRYLVDSMRANNHDFTNKLHVILGLIQMEMYEEATDYIENITMVQRASISKIMNAVDDPSVAALLIGKTARASELNVKFIFREGSNYSRSALNLPSEMLVTLIGNLVDNAFDAMNQSENYSTQKELLFGIYSHPGAVLITVDDNGTGIAKEHLEHIFENGYSTKGEGRGTGLYQVKEMIERFGGTISVESQEGIGTSFSVSFRK